MFEQAPEGAPAIPNNPGWSLGLTTALCMYVVNATHLSRVISSAFSASLHPIDG